MVLNKDTVGGNNMQCLKCGANMEERGTVKLVIDNEEENCTRYECPECGKEVWLNEHSHLYN